MHRPKAGERRSSSGLSRSHRSYPLSKKCPPHWITSVSLLSIPPPHPLTVSTFISSTGKGHNNEIQSQWPANKHSQSKYTKMSQATQAKLMSTMNIVDVTHDWKADLWDWPLQRKDDVVHVRNLPDRWEVGLDAGHFTPEEIEVMMADSQLFIYLHHDERSESHGMVSREVKRSYRLPEDVDPNTVRSHLTLNGVLRITAQKKPAGGGLRGK